MLRTTLLHPAILRALASSGHGGKILIGDGNYPLSTISPPAAERVYLNLAPGILTVTAILETLLTAIPVEAVQVMSPPGGEEPSIFAEFRRHLPTIPLQGLDRFAFYEQARSQDVALVIASGDQRLYANLLLTIGVRPPD